MRRQVSTVVMVVFNDEHLRNWRPGYTVDHINRDASDNRSSNLRWLTQSDQNMNRRIASAEQHELDGIPIQGEKWKRHPHGILVSDHGRVQREGTKRKRVMYTPIAKKAGYRLTSIDKQSFQVSHLVLEAFGFTRPSANHTADHIDRDTSNNRLANLRWATPKEQRANQSCQSERAQQPVEASIVGSSVWQRYASTKLASEATGVRRTNIMAIAKGKQGRCKAKGSDGIVYTFKLAEDDVIDNEVWRSIDPEEWGEGGWYSVV